MQHETRAPLAAVPDPLAVRAELGQRLRELRLLRRLLKLSEAVEREHRTQGSSERRKEATCG